MRIAEAVRIVRAHDPLLRDNRCCFVIFPYGANRVGAGPFDGSDGNP
jgi:hypothetical protein